MLKKVLSKAFAFQIPDVNKAVLFRALSDKTRPTSKNISGIAKPVILIYVASKRQQTVAEIILKEWQSLFSDYQLLLTYSVRKIIPGAIRLFNSELQLVVMRYPIEVCFHKNINRIKPCLILLIEDCFYPRLIRFSKKIGSKVVLINGRVTNGLRLVHRLAPRFLKAVFEQVDLLIMDSVDEANRIGKLGAELSSIMVSNVIDYRYDSFDEKESNRTDTISKVTDAIGALLRRDL